MLLKKTLNVLEACDDSFFSSRSSGFLFLRCKFGQFFSQCIEVVITHIAALP